MANRYIDETTFEILYQNLCMGVSQEELARRYSHDPRFNTQGKISKCVIENGFHTGVPGFQARLYRKHLLGLSREEFRKYLAGYNGNREKRLEDFIAHMENMNKQRQVSQNRPQQIRNTPPNAVPPQYSSPVSGTGSTQLTIGELRRLSPDQMTPQQLATLKAAGYEYDPNFGSWRSAEEIAGEKALAEHEAKMKAAGYVKVTNPLGESQWLTQEEIQAYVAEVLAKDKVRLAELVLEKVSTGQYEFDVALLGHIIPGHKPQQTYSLTTWKVKKRKLPFLPDKVEPDFVDFPSFHLWQSHLYDKDLADVNKTYLMPRGYRINMVTILNKIKAYPGRHDTLIVRLTCEPLGMNTMNNVSSISKICPHCGGVNMPDSAFCSQCGAKFQY